MSKSFWGVFLCSTLFFVACRTLHEGGKSSQVRSDSQASSHWRGPAKYAQIDGSQQIMLTGIAANSILPQTWIVRPQNPISPAISLELNFGVNIEVIGTLSADTVS